MRSHYPARSELYALELAARRERAREIARLLKAGTQALKARIGRILPALNNTKGLRHA